MPEEATKLSIAESFYGSDGNHTPEKEPETKAKPEEKVEPEAKAEPEKKSPVTEGHVEDDPKPPSKEEAAQKTDSSDLDWMDKTPESSHSDDREANESEDSSVKVTYNGREVTVSELAQEAKNLESGYTTKQMELADKRKTLDNELSATEKQKAELATSLSEVENYLKRVIEQEPNWEELKQTLDTDELVLKRIEYAEVKDNLKRVTEQRYVAEADNIKKVVNEQVAILSQKYFPEWKDQKTCEDHIKSVFSGAEKFYDYRIEETKNIMLDNRLFRVMADAVNWRTYKAAQKKLTENKSADTVPKSAKSSGKGLDKKTEDGKKKLSMADSMYPQYSKKETAGV